MAYEKGRIKGRISVTPMSDMDLICRSHRPFQMKTIKWDMLVFILQFPHTWKSLLSSCNVFEPRLQQCYYRLRPRWTMGNRDLLALDDAVTALCCGYLHRIFYGLGLWDCRQVGTGTESLEVDSWDKSADAYQILIFLSSKMHQQTSLFEFGDLKSWFWPHVLPRPSPMCSDALLMWTFAIARDIGSWASTWSTFCPRCGSQFFQCWSQWSLRILLIQLIFWWLISSRTRLRCFEFDGERFPTTRRKRIWWPWIEGNQRSWTEASQEMTRTAPEMVFFAKLIPVGQGAKAPFARPEVIRMGSNQLFRGVPCSLSFKGAYTDRSDHIKPVQTYVLFFAPRHRECISAACKAPLFRRVKRRQLYETMTPWPVLWSGWTWCGERFQTAIQKDNFYDPCDVRP